MRAMSPYSSVMAGGPSREWSMAAKVSSWVDTAGTQGWLGGVRPPAPSHSLALSGSGPAVGFCRPCWAPVLSTAPQDHPALPSPGVPLPTFHVLQDSIQPVNAPVEHEAELEAEQGVSEPRDEGLQAPLGWGRRGQGQGHPRAQGPSTHLLVELLPQGSLEQRCQQVVEPAVGQSGMLRSPHGTHPASPSPPPWLGHQ